jgi:hypothetical protein
MFPLNENLKLARKSKISCIVFDLSCAHINEHGVLGIIEVVMIMMIIVVVIVIDCGS